MHIKEERIVNKEIDIQELRERLKGGSSSKRVVVEEVIKKKKKKKRDSSSSSEKHQEFSSTMITKTDTNVLNQIRAEFRTEIEEKDKEITLLQVTIEELYAEIEAVKEASQGGNAFAIAIEAKSQQAAFEKEKRRIRLELEHQTKVMETQIRTMTECEARIKTYELENREWEKKFREGKARICDKVVKIEVIVPKLVEKPYPVVKYVDKPT